MLAKTQTAGCADEFTIVWVKGPTSETVQSFLKDFLICNEVLVLIRCGTEQEEKLFNLFSERKEPV
jgi:hypothetical protein